MTIRTDLALESREACCHKNLSGVSISEYNDSGTNTSITRVKISSEKGSQLLAKPIGDYITLESQFLATENEEIHQKISQLFAKECGSLIKNFSMKHLQNVLVAGLGNREVTADALGPLVLDHLQVNRHLLNGKQSAQVRLSTITPDVMAKTGMESAEIIKGVIHETHPDLLLVVDALAARNIHRLYSTIQLSTTGIYPGSGVSNHRMAITQESMGIPVIAIGVPTVVDAATICYKCYEQFFDEKQKLSSLLNSNEWKELQGMYVTTKDIDSVIETLGLTLSLGINTLFKNYNSL